MVRLRLLLHAEQSKGQPAAWKAGTGGGCGADGEGGGEHSRRAARRSHGSAARRAPRWPPTAGAQRLGFCTLIAHN